MTSRNSIRPVILGLSAWILASAAIAQEATVANSLTPGNDISASATPASPEFALLASPKAPKITCGGNQLTITADNSTLAGVLAAVHTCIGVQIDVPEGVADKRVFENLGPGPAREVLESLLNGMDLNFAIGSSATDPQKVVSVLLLLQPTETSTVSFTERALTPARRAWLQSRQNGRPTTAPIDDNNQAAVETSDLLATNDASAKPAASQSPSGDIEPPASDTPGASIDSAISPTPAADTSSSSGPAASADKSTIERIADMQQMFVQRRQITQTQNQSQAPTSPQP